MKEGLRQTVERINIRLAVLTEDVRRAVRGEGEFDVESVRKLRAAIEEMAPILAQCVELRRTQPETAEAIDVYRSQLKELQTAITQVRVMLLSQRTRMEANRAHFQSVSQWADTLQQTR